MIKNNLKIEEGSINFWIKENSLNFNDGQSIPIFNINPEGGNILCVKDTDNKLKFFFVVLGKGRIDIEYDISAEDSTKRHMITFTWSLQNKKLIFYFDGQQKVIKDIEFSNS